MRHACLRSLALAALFAAPLPARADTPQYQVTVIGGLAPLTSGPLSTPLALNNNGRVVGYGFTGPDYRTLNWKNGSFMSMGGVTSFDRTFGNQVNILGRVVGGGYYTDPNSGAQLSRAVKWTGGQMSDLGTLGGNSALALSINDNEQIVGGSTTAGDTVTRAFLYQNGSMTALPSLSGATETWAYDISNTGYIAGAAVTSSSPAHPLLWHNGALSQLAIPANARTGAANAVNNVGVAVGTYELDFNTGAFAAALWQNGQLTNLGNLGGPVPYAVAKDINNHDQIVGTSASPSGLAGFLYQAGRMYNLSSLLIAPYAGLQISAAGSINDRGQIAATALVNGQQTAVLLTPILPNVPAPATLSLLATAGIIALRRRR